MMKTLTAIGALSVLGLQAVAGTNLLANPSFETAGPGAIPFAGWTEQFFGNVEFSDAEITALDGTAVCKTYGTFPGPGIQGDTGLIQRIPVTPGQQYTATISVYNSSIDPLGPDNLCLWLVQWKDSGGGSLGELNVQAATPATSQDQWHQVVATGEAPAGATDADVFLLFLQFNNQPGAIFWDDASFVEGDPPATSCNVADVAEPFGLLDLNDITGFISAFTAGCP